MVIRWKLGPVFLCVLKIISLAEYYCYSLVWYKQKKSELNFVRLIEEVIMV
jgi:hypothetical protein